MRRKIFLSVLLLFLSVGSYAQKDQNKIVYQSFPLLESKICEFVKQNHHGLKKSVFLIIRPVVVNNRISYEEYTMYLVGYADVEKEVSDVARKSNRVMKVCNTYIPVYLENIDEVFIDHANIKRKGGVSYVHSWPSGSILGVVNMINEKID